MESRVTLIKGSENAGREFVKTKQEQRLVKALIMIKAGENNGD